MKIVVTGTRGIPHIMGGVETHCEELFPRIAEKGVDVTIACRSNYVKGQQTEWKGVKLITLKTPKRKSLEAIIHTWRAILYAHKNGADIVHINAIGPALLTPLAKLLGLKVVFTHHGPDYDRAKWGTFAKIMLRLGERMGCLFADEVIVISNVIRDFVIKKYGRAEHVHLIYNGVPQPDFCDYPEYFKELGIEKRKYVLGMCRFVPEKNLHHLLEAFDKIPNSMIKLVLAGDTDFEDDYSRSLKKMAKEKGVVLTGFVRGKKLHSLLTNALCYCLPSSHEGLPIALLEAMSYKLPIIVSDIPANLEVALPDKDYFHCGDVNQLTKRLEEKISACENDKVEYDMSKYDWDEIARQTYDIYMSM